MKICIVSNASPFDRKAFSGISYYICDSLSKEHNVEWIGEVPLNKWESFFLLLNKAYSKIRGFRVTERVGFVSKIYGKKFSKKLRHADYDVIFAPAASVSVAYLKTSIPIIYLSDATFNLMIGYYPNFTGLSPRNVKNGNKIEGNAIKNARQVIYSSQWAAESAVNFYGADPAKVSVIDFGPNLLPLPRREETGRAVQNREVCNLLFIGVDWIRKGGNKAYEIYLHLRKQGFPCSLTIIGCSPALTEEIDHVTIIPYLDKKKEEDAIVLYEHLLNAHFFLLPTLADCTPIVFSEAAAFGLPVLTTNTGGIPSVIKEGLNGFMFPVNADAQKYGETIKRIFNDLSLYTALRETSRNEYETRLNWDTWRAKFNDIAHQVTGVAGKDPATVLS